MRIGLLVDSSCDLPRDFVERHNIAIMPITVEVGGHSIVDMREEETTRRFYRDHLAARSDAHTLPCSQAQIQELILTRLVKEFDYVFCVTIASSRSPIHDHAVRAVAEAMLCYKEPRRQAGNPTPFAMRVIDSQNAFAAEALVAAAAAHGIAAGMPLTQIRDQVLALIPEVHGYMLPRDLHHLRMRARARGDRSVSWLSATMGNALDIKPLIKGYRNQTFACAKLRNFESGAQRLFDYAARRVEAGLLLPIVTTCYAGDLAELYALPGFHHLAQVCTRRGVMLLSSVMSMAGASNVGDGALGLALAADAHDFDG